MDFAGLIGKFRINRPLNSQEGLFRLHQQQRLDVEPHYQMSVIKMNSTYLQSVAKWFGSKGTITQVTLITIGIFVTLFVGMLHVSYTRVPRIGRDNDDAAVLIFAAVLISPLVALAIWTMCKEAFAFTHYPMRFNRKTRMVYVFRTKGTVLSVPWDQVFFTMSQMDHVYKFWNVMGHVLEDDKVTVKESFALSVVGLGSPDGLTMMRSHWEFIRRYMEDGPESITGQVQFCLPIADRRESLTFGLHRLLANTGGSLLLLPIRLIGTILELSTLPFRYFAVQTSRIPRWPDQVDAACVVEPDDPYAITGAKNADRVAVFPAAAEAAGMSFKAPPNNPLAPTPVPSTASKKKQ